MFESAEQLLLAQFDMAPLSSLYVPPAMRGKQHADIALLDASQAEFEKLLLGLCLPQPKPSNE